MLNGVIEMKNNQARQAELEQSLKGLAMTLGTYYRELLEVGFTEQQAMYLIGNYQISILDHVQYNRQDSKDDDE